MSSTPIRTIGQLKEAIRILEQHHCICNQTPVSVLGRMAFLEFNQEHDELKLMSGREIQTNQCQAPLAHSASESMIENLKLRKWKMKKWC